MAKEAEQKPDETETETIPKERLDAEIAKTQQAEDQLKTLQAQMNLMQANAQQPKQPPKEQDIFEGIFEEGETVPDVNQLREILRRFDAKYSSAVSNVLSMVQFPDYQRTVTEHLPTAIKNNPALQELVANAGPNTMKIAYAFASYEKQLAEKSGSQQPPANTPEAQAALQAALQAAEQPDSASSVQSKAAMDLAQRVGKMTDEEMDAEAERIKTQETTG